MRRRLGLFVLVALVIAILHVGNEPEARHTRRKPSARSVPRTELEPDVPGRPRLLADLGAAVPDPATMPTVESGEGVSVGREPPRLRLPGDASSALELGLRWLALQADADGSWGSVRDSALVLLAFLGAGYTDRGEAKENRYAHEVKSGVEWLMRQQDGSGRFCSDAESQALAALALTEMSWWTGDSRYRRPARDALAALARMRRPQGSWEGDLRVTAWATLALRAGQWARLGVDPGAFSGIRTWIELRAATTDATEQTAMVLTRILLGERPQGSAAMAPMAEWLGTQIPLADDTTASERWILGLLAAYQVGSSTWPPWFRAAMDRIRHEQRNRPAGPHAGGWPPLDDRCAPLAAHAMLLLCLEVSQRYPRTVAPTD